MINEKYIFFKLFNYLNISSTIARLFASDPYTLGQHFVNATTSETFLHLQRENERKKEITRKEEEEKKKRKEKLSRCILRSDSFSGINARMQRRKNIS